MRTEGVCADRKTQHAFIRLGCWLSESGRGSKLSAERRKKEIGSQTQLWNNSAPSATGSEASQTDEHGRHESGHPAQLCLSMLENGLLVFEAGAKVLQANRHQHKPGKWKSAQLKSGCGRWAGLPKSKWGSRRR